MLQNYPAILLTILERGVINKQGRVFITARLKIFPSYHQELKSHQIPEHIEVLYYFCQKKTPATFPRLLSPHRSRVCPMFIPLYFESARVFITVIERSPWRVFQDDHFLLLVQSDLPWLLQIMM